MPYYEVTVRAEKCVCVKADNEEDAIQTAQDECAAFWGSSEADIEDDYGDGTEPQVAEWIAQYKRDGEYYETGYNEDVPPA
jgi:hypothetical protein